MEFLSAIVDNLPVAVFCKDVEDDMRVIVWNKNAERMLGYSAEHVIGKTAFDYLPADAAEKYAAADRIALSGDKVLFETNQIALNPKTQSEVFFRIWKIPVQTKKGEILLCIAQDLTEIKSAELENRRRERQLQNISTNSPGLLYQFKADVQRNFSFPFCSAKSFDVLGVKSEKIVSDANAIIGLIHEDDMASFQESLVVTMRDLSPWHWEGRLRTENKGLRWFQGASTPFMQDDGSILWDGLLLDITAQKEIEERLRMQDAKLASTSKLVALGEMAGGVAHEINTPLNAILLCADQIQSSLRDDTVDKQEMLEMSGLISETAQRIAKIVRGLKSFARDGSKEDLEDTDAEMLVDETLSLCRQRMEQNGVKLNFVKPAYPIVMNCRSIQIGQVILNLLNNSFDAVIGTVDPWIKLEIKSDGQIVYFEVTDSGPGLPAEVRARLFQPFFTTKEFGKGTGIGLSISKGIIESHHGEILVDDTSPNTKFVVAIPLDSQLSLAA